MDNNKWLNALATIILAGMGGYIGFMYAALFEASAVAGTLIGAVLFPGLAWSEATSESD